ncbi:MBL fold metallo-hydrolase [Prochlorothrix hollandica]|uniref:MBL fold metallo-hydrolase n=1 Tax=Prochlorothrix hollandica TaxID=1223 RepID=UPI001CECCAAE|nr:MBL fold metallo-hydrolase [Prochlorothrix hollandica]
MPTTPSLSPPPPHCHPFSVRFWGVRGNIPTPGPQWVEFGGNTACIEVRVGGECLIFDGGTGLRLLGQQLVTRAETTAHLFFTHSYWDRIQGFPFFQPAFQPHYCLHIYGGTAVTGASIKQCLMAQMVRPNFPIPLPKMRAKLLFHDLAPGESWEIAATGSSGLGVTPTLVSAPESGSPIIVETCSLNRFDRAIGYRVSWNGSTLVYATDVSHGPYSDPALLHLARGADVLIYDAAYSEPMPFVPGGSIAGESGSRSPGDPYSAPGLEILWHQGLAVAEAAGVGQLVLFHHSPDYDDGQLLALESQMQQNFPTSCLAREGMHLILNPGQP